MTRSDGAGQETDPAYFAVHAPMQVMRYDLDGRDACAWENLIRKTSVWRLAIYAVCTGLSGFSLAFLRPSTDSGRLSLWSCCRVGAAAVPSQGAATLSAKGFGSAGDLGRPFCPTPQSLASRSAASSGAGIRLRFYLDFAASVRAIPGERAFDYPGFGFQKRR